MNRIALALWVALLSTLAASAQAQIWIGINDPDSNQVVTGNEVAINVTTMGVVARVEATVGSRVLMLQGSGATYTGKLSLAGEAAGTKSLVITAVDPQGMTSTASVSFVLDTSAPPTITLHEPASGLVLRQDAAAVRVRATCVSTGPGGCTFAAPAVTTGPELDVMVPLNPMPPGGTTIEVRANDASGRTISRSTLVYLEPSPRLQELITADEGEVLDFDGTRALVRSPDRKRISLWTAAAARQVLHQGDLPIERAKLFPLGALLVSDSLNDGRTGPREVWLWKDGLLTRLDAINAQVSGKWLATVTRAPASATTGAIDNLTLRDMDAQQNVWSTDYTAPNNVVISSVELADDGDLLWVADLMSPRWRRDGTLITVAATSGSRAFQIDQVNLSYVTGGLTSTAKLHTGSGEMDLCLSNPTHDCQTPALSGGWVGYSTIVPLPAGSRMSAFRRNPPGGVEPFTALPDAHPVAMSSSGEAVLSGRPDLEAPYRRYLARTPSSATEVSADHGRAVHRGDWYLLLGRSVFRITDSAGPANDGGVPTSDGGVPDASAPATPEGGVVDASSGDASQVTPDPVDAGVHAFDAAVTNPFPDAGTARDGGPSSNLDAGDVASRDAASGDAAVADGPLPPQPGRGRAHGGRDDGCAVGGDGDGSPRADLLLVLVALVGSRMRRGRRKHES